MFFVMSHKQCVFEKVAKCREVPFKVVREPDVTHGGGDHLTTIMISTRIAVSSSGDVCFLVCLRSGRVEVTLVEASL